MGERQNKKSTTLLLVGRTGNGKSATGNTILGFKAFKSARMFSSVTKQCEMSSSERKDGRLLTVVDTPGLFDPATSMEEVSKEIKNCMQLAKGGLHGVLLILSLVNRFTPEEAAVLDCLQIIFGPNVLNYMVVIFTNADNLDDDETFEDRLKSSPKQLNDLLHRCKHRVVLFNNKKRPSESEKQVNELLKEVDSIVAENGGQPYSDNLFQKFQQLARRLRGQDEHSKEETEKILSQIYETVENRVTKAVAKMQEQLVLEQAAHQETQNKVKKLEHTIVEFSRKSKKRCNIL